MTVHQFPDPFALRKSAVAGVLEQLCRELEPSQTQLNDARAKYEAVGAWLAGAADLSIQRLKIYLQGSTAIGTTVKPLFDNEYDVDLVSHIPGYEHRAPAQIKKLIGDRLRESGHYVPILVEKTRCWRLNYANEFHLDITPSIANPACPNGGELVPDRKLQCWKASNPKGYKALFEQRAAIVPNMRLAKFDSATARANVEPYPDAPRFKSVLCRIVQLSKRHRDVHFQFDCKLAPISIIITTLAMKAYEYCARRETYDSELDLLIAVIRCMPLFIDREMSGGRMLWFVWNETTAGENFAERWNEVLTLPNAFFTWHAKLVKDLEQLKHVEGMDLLGRSLKESFGDGPTDRAMATITKEVSVARADRTLYAAPRLGLIVGTGVAAVTGAAAVKANTFFGADLE